MIYRKDSYIHTPPPHDDDDDDDDDDGVKTLHHYTNTIPLYHYT